MNTVRLWSWPRRCRHILVKGLQISVVFTHHRRDIVTDFIVIRLIEMYGVKAEIHIVAVIVGRCDQALGYLTDLRRQFAEYWGGTLCNVMRPLNHYIHHTEDEDDEEQHGVHRRRPALAAHIDCDCEKFIDPQSHKQQHKQQKRKISSQNSACYHCHIYCAEDGARNKVFHMPCRSP